MKKVENTSHGFAIGDRVFLVAGEPCRKSILPMGLPLLPLEVALGLPRLGLALGLPRLGLALGLLRLGFALGFDMGDPVSVLCCSRDNLR